MTIYNPHTKTDCTATDLFTVSEGVQCGNCLALVTDHRYRNDTAFILDKPRLSTTPEPLKLPNKPTPSGFRFNPVTWAGLLKEHKAARFTHNANYQHGAQNYRLQSGEGILFPDAPSIVYGAHLVMVLKNINGVAEMKITPDELQISSDTAMTRLKWHRPKSADLVVPVVL